MYRYISVMLITVLSLGASSALEVDLSASDVRYGQPIVSDCIESSIGCSRIISDPIERSVEVSTSPVNDTHEAWTATVSVSTSFSGTYRNVPLTIEIPKTAQLNAGGNAPYTITTHGNRRFIELSIPELEDERTVRVTVLTERQPSLWQRLSRIVGAF